MVTTLSLTLPIPNPAPTQVSAAAGGKGGVEAEAVGRLVKQLGGGLRQLVFVSSHGTLRCAQMPWTMRNLLGQLDKLRAAEQAISLHLPASPCICL